MDENDWKYHGEGNKSLVVSHVQHSRVLRLLKYPCEDAENTHQTTEQAFQHILNIVDYSRNVMKPLLGEKYVHSGEVVKLPLDFVRQLSLKIQQERPELRCDKVMDTFSGCGLCLPNLTHLSPCHFGDHRPPLCVEIKGGELIYSCKDDAKQQPDLNELVQYLWPYFHHSNSHQSSRTVLSEFIQVICSALLSTGDASRSTEQRKMKLSDSRVICEASPVHRDLLCNGSPGLPKDCVLAKILQVQMMDSLDIEGLYPLYKRVEQYLEENRLQVDGPYDLSFLEKVKTCPSEDDGSIEYAVAKDCSIMITFTPCGEDEKLQPHLEIQPTKSRFAFSVSILDLDPKPYESIPHQFKLDTKIVNYYLKSTIGAQALPPSSLYSERQDCTLLFHPV
ncbi:Inositol-pentakisphosphate 2-kinase [Bagarius yarrelli]|uniref:Inositol-pentakisphosphate 2-kinase n=1 Tax=Bagarius yarrelli TaxID=175774 RepID=A0A556U3R7_BAGYA|nr:Inositol-pentakisphosphate 2-kinase [Bagarius yarrelli]